MVVGELTQERDVMVIGGGPGGYHAAIRAAQLGRQVTIIEKNKLGGVCLNEGCIPSKVHTAAAQVFQRMKPFQQLGLDTSGVTFDLPRLQEHKQKVVEQLFQGVVALCKANKIEIIEGEASFISASKIGVENGHQYDTFTYNDVIIATGCSKKPIAEINPQALTPTSIWNLEELPSELILYGNDDFTLEAATTFNSLGSRVTLILPPGQHEFTFDPSINKELQRQLKKQKIKLYKTEITPKFRFEENQWEVVFENDKNESVILESSHLYCAEERYPVTESLGIQRAGIHISDEGFIKINEACRTNNTSIYAIGDITEGPALAVKAIKQGKVAAENMAGYQSECDFTFLPRIIQTIPPIAAVGMTETNAVENGFEVKIGESTLQTNGYASILGQKEGFSKTVTDTKTDLVLGIHMMGAQAVEMISTGTLALEMVARQEDMLFPSYPHPSVNESMWESVEDLDGKAIHKAPRATKQKVTSS
ncbi:dihydrolipoyl dehydrogenase family protein [Sutcliffiella horikoshii]|uniref:dihydrolipoyl dehydrogenase family protein n=1 Tax=Sutcliffiella horikoshii TaxID=79883 RepID=UPI001F463104|nr:FAD-dependent oxidoreductase [Sutcliffiella horikoshii]MCG1021010.1 FAD-dependent oxidoreductase [Sutcliffiella horikoshii]